MKKVISVNESLQGSTQKTLGKHHLLLIGLGISATVFFIGMFVHKHSDNHNLETSSNALTIASLFSILYFLSRFTCVSEKNDTNR